MRSVWRSSAPPWNAMKPNGLRSSTRSTAPGSASARPNPSPPPTLTAIIVPPVRSDVVLVWMDLEMTGLDHLHDVIVEIATIVTDDELDDHRRGPGPRGPRRRRRPRRHGPVRRRDAHPLGAARGDPRVDDRAGGRRRADVGVHPRARPRARDRAAVRQLDRHRPAVPRRLPARDRGAPALPVDRRVEHQGARAALVPEGAPGPAAEGRQPPRPRRHPGLHRGAALLPRAGLRAPRTPTRRRRQERPE